MPTYHYVTDGNPDGSMIGASATEKVGFFGKDPVVQQTARADVASTLVSLKSGVNAILAKLRALGLIAT